MYWKLVGFLAVFIASIACYWNSLNGDLVHDDRFAIKENSDVRPEAPLRQLFLNDFWGKRMSDPTSHKSYRPLTTLTFRMNYLLHKLEPWGYHVVNVVLHSLASLLVSFLCWRVVFGSPSSAVLAGLLFRLCIRSIQKQCVKSRTFMGSLLWLVSCAGCGVAATLCKELGITVFGVCWIYDVINIAKHHSRSLSSRGVLSFMFEEKWFCIRVIFLSILVVVLLGFRLHLLDGQLPRFINEDNPASFSDSLLTRILTYNYLYAANGEFLVAPITLSYDWQCNSIPLLQGVQDLRNAETIVFYMYVSLLFIRGCNDVYKRAGCTTAIGLALTVVPFLPASNIFFRVGFVLAERVLYIPSIGYCILVVHGVVTLEDWLRGKLNRVSSKTCPPTDNNPLTVPPTSTRSSGGKVSRTPRASYLSYWPTLCLLFVCGVFAAKTVVRNRVWWTRESLFMSGVETLPHNTKVHYNYANLLRDTGRTEDAISHYKEAVRLSPDHASSHNNLGTLLGREEAEYHLREAVKHNPLHSRAHYNLGNLLSGSGRYQEALQALQESLSLNKGFPDAWSSYGGVLVKLGRWTEAVSALNKVLELRTDNPDLYCNVATYFEELGLYDRAIEAASEALLLRAEHSHALRILGHSHRQLGRNDKVEDYYLRSLRSKADPNTLHLLSAFYYNSGMLQKAADAAAQLLSIDPSHQDGVMTHALSLVELGRNREAFESLKNATRLFPQSASPYKHLSLLLSRQRRFEEALEYGERAVALDDSDTSALTILGNIHKELKQYAKSKEMFSKVVELNPGDGSARLNLGAISHLMGNLEEAKNHYKMAEKFQNTRTLAQENLEKVERLLSKHK